MGSRISRFIDRLVSRFLPDLDIFPDYSPDEPKTPIDPKKWLHWPSGSLPHSLQVPKIKLYRYHPRQYLDTSERWYRMFWDGDHKWATKARFAGDGVVPGHFFSLSPQGALAEIEAYQANVEDYELACYTMSVDRVLDLTSLEA